jgi:hypothetical protein
MKLAYMRPQSLTQHHEVNVKTVVVIEILELSRGVSLPSIDLQLPVIEAVEFR